MDKAQLKSLRDEIKVALRPILEKYGLETAYQSKITENKFGKVTFAFESSTKQSANIRLNAWRFLLDDACNAIDLRRPFFFDNEPHVVVDIDPRRKDAPWIVEGPTGRKTYFSTQVLQESLLKSEGKYRPKVPLRSAEEVAKSYAAWS